MEVFMINYFDDLNFKLSPSSLSAAPRQSSIDINKFTLKTLKVAVPRRSPLGRRLEVFMKHKIMQTILCIYFLSVQKIAQALIGAKKRGIDVQMVIDQICMTSCGKGKMLQENGIPVYVHRTLEFNPYTMPLMHHKFFIFGCNKEKKNL